MVSQMYMSLLEWDLKPTGQVKCKAETGGAGLQLSMLHTSDLTQENNASGVS